MKKNIILSIVIILTFSISSCKRKIPKTVEMNTLEDSASYCIGIFMGQNIKSSGEDKLINLDIFYTAMHHALDSMDLQIPESKRNDIMTKYSKIVRKRQEEKLKHESEENLEAGNEFLAKNKTREGVITTESGLQYEIMKEGNGPKPDSTDKVKVHYHGTLIDGTVFDSSVERNQPAEFLVNRVIKGWTEALQLMPVGSKWKIYISADLAYGPQRRSAQIGPNATLIFEVELLDIVTDKKSSKK